MVDPLTAAVVATNVIGGILGSNKANKANKSAERVLDAQMEEWRQLNMPNLSPVEFEKYKELFAPQMAQDSLMQNIQTDPALRDAQMAALSQLGDISEGGLTLQDKADLADIQGEVARQDAARQGAIMQNMAERGLGGAGMELAQRLQAQSAGADRAASDARNVAAQAQQRALDAIMRRGSLGGEMRAQQFGEDAAKARAQDAMNMYNTGMLNEAQRNKQQIANQNTDLGNQQAMQANQIAQQNYENELSKLGGQSGLASKRAGVTSNRGMREASSIGSAASGASQILGSLFSGNNKAKFLD